MYTCRYICLVWVDEASLLCDFSSWPPKQTQCVSLQRHRWLMTERGTISALGTYHIYIYIYTKYYNVILYYVFNVYILTYEYIYIYYVYIEYHIYICMQIHVLWTSGQSCSLHMSTEPANELYFNLPLPTLTITGANQHVSDPKNHAGRLLILA